MNKIKYNNINNSLNNNENGSENNIIIHRERKARKLLKYYKYINHNMNVLDKYTIVDIITESIHTGGVYICENKSNNNKYIMKKLYKNSTSYKEIYIHAYIQDDHVVNIIDLYIDNKYIYMILDYKRDGDLADYIDTRDNLTFKESVDILYRAIHLVKHIHRLGVIHGDIKPENILINNLDMYLCDFGFSVFINNPRTSYYLYTHPYTAPEQLKYRTFTYKSDVWSLGVILYVLCFNVYPFTYDDENDYSPYEMYQLIKNNPLVFPDDAPKNIIKLLNGMLDININNRWSLDDVKNYINKIKRYEISV